METFSTTCVLFVFVFTALAWPAPLFHSSLASSLLPSCVLDTAFPFCFISHVESIRPRLVRGRANIPGQHWEPLGEVLGVPGRLWRAARRWLSEAVLNVHVGWSHPKWTALSTSAHTCCYNKSPHVSQVTACCFSSLPRSICKSVHFCLWGPNLDTLLHKRNRLNFQWGPFTLNLL